MDSAGNDIVNRLEVYAQRKGLQLRRRLGQGIDGTVWSTNRATAVKVHERPHTYIQELEAYRRLQEHDVVSIRGHAVPQLVAWDDELLVIEMTIVQPPFLLDFASAHFDEAPDFSEEVVEQWREEKREQFEDRWPQVESILGELRSRYGIHLLDTHPGNLTFAEQPN